MSKPMISVAGIRGTVGDSFVPEEFLKFTSAYASTLSNKTIALGSDTRPSGDMVRHLVLAGCFATGCHVLDLGVCPTPTLGFMVKKLGAGGGVAVTASHNPLDWNALKFYSPEGTLLTAAEMDAVLDRYRSGHFDYQSCRNLGAMEKVKEPLRPHIEKVLGAVDVAGIRAARFKVAVDLCNGAGITLLPELLGELGCEVTTVFGDPDKAFERVAEPLVENLGALGGAVRSSGAAIGFAVDPDADRLALVDETGRAIGEERTLVLAARSVLQKRALTNPALPSPLVANLSTTRAMDDVAAEFGTRVERTRIGEAYVVERILSCGSAIGGEGNGGVIYPVTHLGRDSATGIALMLEALTVSGKTVSQLNSEVRDYAMVKNKVGIEGKELHRIFVRLCVSFTGVTAFDDTDGLKISFDHSWVHVRASGTEPILRVYAEAPTIAEAKGLADKAMRIAQM
jgi:phosphomannomutase